jgi:hypothetical protein
MANKTLTQLLTLVGLRYERNSVNNDAETAARTAALNESQRTMALMLGDHCWYLQRVENVTWTAAPGFAQALDDEIQRITYIEHPTVAGQEITHRTSGVNSDGELLVILDYVPSTTIPVHYVVAPTELATGSDETQVPDLYIDALVLGACMELAVGGGSAALLEAWTAKFHDRMRFVSRDCMRRHRQREETQEVRLDPGGWNAGCTELGPYVS